MMQVKNRFFKIGNCLSILILSFLKFLHKKGQPFMHLVSKCLYFLFKLLLQLDNLKILKDRLISLRIFIALNHRLHVIIIALIMLLNINSIRNVISYRLCILLTLAIKQTSNFYWRVLLIMSIEYLLID